MENRSIEVTAAATLECCDRRKKARKSFEAMPAAVGRDGITGWSTPTSPTQNPGFHSASPSPVIIRYLDLLSTPKTSEVLFPLFYGRFVRGTYLLHEGHYKAQSWRYGSPRNWLFRGITFETTPFMMFSVTCVIVHLPYFEVYARLHWWPTTSPLVSPCDTWRSRVLIILHEDYQLC